MLNKTEVQDIFEFFVPDTVQVKFVTKDHFITTALNNPYIRHQIEIGIYTLDNIWTDFLSAACAYSLLNVLEVCYDLLVAHAEGVDDELTRAYVTMMAVHEAHHFHVNHVPDSVHEHAEAEVDCLRETMEAYPDLSVQVAQFEACSPVYHRVYDRMRRAFPEQFFS